MEPILEKLVLCNEYSFRIHHIVHSHFISPWHFHPEHEIMLVEESKGMRFVGDHIESFTKGDLVFVGKNLPHYWRNDNIYLKKKSSLKARALIIQFNNDAWEEMLKYLPEAKIIANLFKKAQKGIKFTGKIRNHLSKRIKRLESYTNFERFIEFASILNTMATTNDYELLSSDGFIERYRQNNNTKHDKIFTYIMENFTKKILLKDMACIANMSETNFCRYFKKRTHKSFTTYLNEIRIGFACKLLLEEEMNIAQICYESGFNNISNFNEQFKKFTIQTPREYLKKHKNYQ